jgi:hypothetical protein
MMAVIVARIFALDVDGKPTLAFEARNWIEAHELSREPPIHHHESADEFFYVIAGDMTFMVGTEVRRIGRWRLRPDSLQYRPRLCPFILKTRNFCSTLSPRVLSGCS